METEVEVKRIGLDKVEKMMSLIKLEDVIKGAEKYSADIYEERLLYIPTGHLSECGGEETESDFLLDGFLFEITLIYRRLETKEWNAYSRDIKGRIISDYEVKVMSLIGDRAGELEAEQKNINN